jgi:hypothetical protein
MQSGNEMAPPINPGPMDLPAEVVSPGLDPVVVSEILSTLDQLTSGDIGEIPSLPQPQGLIPPEFEPAQLPTQPESLPTQLQGILDPAVVDYPSMVNTWIDLANTLPVELTTQPLTIPNLDMGNQAVNSTSASGLGRTAIPMPALSTDITAANNPDVSINLPRVTTEDLPIAPITTRQTVEVDTPQLSRSLATPNLRATASTLSSRASDLETSSTPFSPAGGSYSGGSYSVGTYTAPVCPTLGEPLSVGLRKFVKLTQDLSQTHDREDRIRLERELYEQGLKLPELADADPTLKQAMEGSLALDCDQLVSEVTATLQQVADYLGAMRDIRTGILW